MSITCPYCSKPAVLVGGDVIYPHRLDLESLKFWNCSPCRAYVGCHKKGAWVRDGKKKVMSDGTIPLGRLANADLRKAKSAAHLAFDPLWKNGERTRNQAYDWLAKKLGIQIKECHIGQFDLDTCNKVVGFCKNL